MALKANPADDTARLVYADWLDDHDQPHKAEYLRLVAELARQSDDVAEHPQASRVVELGEQLADGWRYAAGSRFSLVVDDFYDLVKTIRWYREITGDGLGEAKVALQSAPHAIYACVPFEAAHAAWSLHPTGSCRLRITHGTVRQDNTCNYQLSIRASLSRSRSTEAEFAPVPSAVRETLNRCFLRAGLVLSDETMRAVRSESGFVLALGLSWDHARGRIGEFFARSIQPLRLLGIWELWITRSSEPL